MNKLLDRLTKNRKFSFNSKNFEEELKSKSNSTISENLPAHNSMALSLNLQRNPSLFFKKSIMRNINTNNSNSNEKKERRNLKSQIYESSPISKNYLSRRLNSLKNSHIEKNFSDYKNEMDNEKIKFLKKKSLFKRKKNYDTKILFKNRLSLISSLSIETKFEEQKFEDIKKLKSIFLEDYLENKKFLNTNKDLENFNEEECKILLETEINLDQNKQKKSKKNFIKLKDLNFITINK